MHRDRPCSGETELLVAVFRARDRRMPFSVPVWPPPQHITCDGAYADLTSG